MVLGFLRAGLFGRSGLVELCFLRPVDRLLSLLQLPFRVSSDCRFLQIADLAGDLSMLVVRPPYDRTTVVIVHQIPERDGRRLLGGCRACRVDIPILHL